MLIATHDGTFHADETTACAIISYIYDNTEILRTRDPEKMEKADLVIDVSLINDAKHYDHHAKDFTLSRESGVRYATAGLMWKKFGMDFLKKVVKKELGFHPDAKVLEAAFERIDREFMVMVDLNDNGQLTEYAGTVAACSDSDEAALRDRLIEFYSDDPDIPYIVAMQNLPNNKDEAQNRAFMNTVKMLRQILVPCAINALHTESGIARVLETYQGGKLLIMEERLPWTQAVLQHPEDFKDCLLAVYPDRNGRWRVQSLPVSKALRFCNRLSAPAAWRGLQGSQLDKAAGIAGLNFIHRSGFTGGGETYDSNLALARAWLEKGEPYRGN